MYVQYYSTVISAVFEHMLKEPHTLMIKEWITGPIKHKHYTMRDFIECTLPKEPEMKYQN